ncbi:restriction endonuclease subunit S [Paenibacillus sp. FSL R10-2734]|uniref:restriction endonuclease subunit S n=1 Tax=Paenibacillus sp. FSL R10-2734 TaxID=2954691 RepID=UPI0030DA8B46
MSKLLDIIEKPLPGEWGSDDDAGKGTPVLRTTNFTNNGTIDYSNVVTRTIDAKKMKEKYLINGDIIIEKSGGSPAQPVGRVVFFEGGNNKYLFNNFTSVIRLKDKNVNSPKYLFYHLFYNYRMGGTRKFTNKTTGISNLKLDRFIKETEIFLPSLVTQKRISISLDTAVELLAMRKQQLAELDNLIKSTFYDMFGDPVTNEKGWRIKRLSEIGDLNRGISKHRPRNEPTLLGGIHPLIQTGDIANADFIIRQYKQTYSDLGLKQSKKWEAGTLCITIAANIAKTAILGFDACFPDSVVGFNANEKTNNIFVYIWFDFFQKIIEAQAPESAQKNINLRILNELDIISPPIELQTQFANFVTKIEEQKALVKQAIDETQHLFDSLMSEYFE